MRTKPFVRTLEFLWQEGHTAHATAEEAQGSPANLPHSPANLPHSPANLPHPPVILPHAGGDDEDDQRVPRVCGDGGGHPRGGRAQVQKRVLRRRRRHLHHRGNDEGLQGPAGD
eukprot:1178271-Prorocentrum_minimum.AAC.1